MESINFSSLSERKTRFAISNVFKKNKHLSKNIESSLISFEHEVDRIADEIQVGHKDKSKEIEVIMLMFLNVEKAFIIAKDSGDYSYEEIDPLEKRIEKIKKKLDKLI